VPALEEWIQAAVMGREDRRRRRPGGLVGRLLEKREAASRFGYRGNPRGKVGDRRRGPGRRVAAAASEQ
jgi:hypothetical protein